MNESKEMRLTGGTFFTLLIKGSYEKISSKTKASGIADPMSNTNIMFGLMGIVILAMIYFQVILFRQIAIIGSYYTIITCVGLFFFADRQMIHELKKKFHY